jgi:hypothetical protein
MGLQKSSLGILDSFVCCDYDRAKIRYICIHFWCWDVGIRKFCGADVEKVGQNLRFHSSVAALSLSLDVYASNGWCDTMVMNGSEWCNASVWHYTCRIGYYWQKPQSFWSIAYGKFWQQDDDTFMQEGVEALDLKPWSRVDKVQLKWLLPHLMGACHVYLNSCHIRVVKICNDAPPHGMRMSET